MRVHPSALKHGCSPEDAIQAAEWSLWIEPLDDDGSPDRELRLGSDTVGRLLETVILVFPSGDQLIIHAHAGPQEVPGPLAVSSVAIDLSAWSVRLRRPTRRRQSRAAA